MKTSKFGNKNDVADFVKKAYLHKSLINIDEEFGSNKAKQTEVKTKLEDLEKNVKLIITKGLTENLINEFSILNGAKYFSSDGLQKYLVFISARRIYQINKDGSDKKLNRGNLRKCQKKVLKIYILQTLVLLRS